MKISIIGTGAYGLAIAHALERNDNKIWMWTENKKLAMEFKKTKQVKSLITNNLTNKILISMDMQKVLESTNLIIIATTSKFVGLVCDNIKTYYINNLPICIATKGIDDATNKFLSVLVKEKLKTNNIAVLSGPSFAIDILNDEIAALTLATNKKQTGKLIEKIFESNKMKLRVNSDLIGVQICGCVKNIIAIASGILAGLGYSNSTQAFLITESIHDIKDIINYLGGDKKTVLSYAGIGDLLLTCTSIKSRNYSYGYNLGKSRLEALEYLNKTTVEGYYAINSFYHLLKDSKVKAPIINLMYDIVYKNADPQKLETFLINKK